jgi:hypothetical protein
MKRRLTSIAGRMNHCVLVSKTNVDFMLNIYTIQLFSITKKCLFFNYYKLKFIFQLFKVFSYRLSFTGEINDFLFPTFKRYAQNSLLSPKASAISWVFLPSFCY